MDSYVRRLLDLPPLDRDDEVALARRMRIGDVEARAQLIESGMRNVALRAVMRGWRGADLLDAVQSGALGLISAVDRFDPENGARLSTYAWRWIGHAMSVTGTQVLPLDHPSGDADAEQAADIADAEALLDGLETLNAADAEVIRRRFRIGEDPGRPRPRQEVADMLGLSLSQVRTCETRAMRHLRQRLGRVVHRAPQRGAGPL